MGYLKIYKYVVVTNAFPFLLEHIFSISREQAPVTVLSHCHAERIVLSSSIGPVNLPCLASKDKKREEKREHIYIYMCAKRSC